jgi:hypothetical protein
MKRIVIVFCAVLGLTLSAGKSQASWGYVGYSGYQPWWNIFAKRYKCLTPEEERLQKFWHDYYDALMHFYKALDHIDWVAYYKNHGYQINAGGYGGGPGCCGRINYAPVFVSPTLQWAVPAGCAGGPPGVAPGAPYGPMSCGPMGCGGGGYGPMVSGGVPMISNSPSAPLVSMPSASPMPAAGSPVSTMLPGTN